LPDEVDSEFWKSRLSQCLQPPSSEDGSSPKSLKSKIGLKREQLEIKSESFNQFATIPISSLLMNIDSDQYVKGGLIGNGTSGKVYFYYDSMTGNGLACKQIRVPDTVYDLFIIFREIFSLISVAHLTVVPIVGWSFRPRSRGQSKGDFLLATPFMANKSLGIRKFYQGKHILDLSTEKTIIFMVLQEG